MTKMATKDIMILGADTFHITFKERKASHFPPPAV